MNPFSMNPFSMNPFTIENVAPNRLVSEYVNQTRYSGGVAGLGQCLPARRQARGLGHLGQEIADMSLPNGGCPAGEVPTPTPGYPDDLTCQPAPKPYKITPEAKSSIEIVKVDEDSGGGFFSSIASFFGGGDKKTAEKEDDGPGFFSSFTDAAGKAFTDAFGKRQGGYLSQREKKSSPWPWVIGGVAVLGIGAFVLTRGKK